MQRINSITRHLLSPLIWTWLMLALLPIGAWAAEAPEWFIEHIQMLSADGGVWRTDNAQYRSEQEPIDAYVLEWRSGIGGHSLVGRMYGVSGDKRSGDYWEFRLFWHGGEDRVMAYQFGWNGAVGMGPMYQAGVEGHKQQRMEQVFYSREGERSMVGHEAEFDASGAQITRSFNITASGDWLPRREYRWVHQAATGGP